MTEQTALTSQSLWSDARRRLREDRGALIASGIVLFIAILAAVGPVLSPYAYDGLDWKHLAVGPQFTSSHWLGTDRLGRDLFVRTLFGVRISMFVGLLATAVSLVIGVAWGAVAGYVGGRTDGLMMRFVDVLYSLPYLFIVIIFSTLLGRGSLTALFMAIGAVGWLTTARIVRGQTLSLKNREFLEAARATGVGTPAILLRHVVPNLVGPVAIYATLTIPEMILFESFLSFLGVGVQEPLASLGSLINSGAQEMQSGPWMLLVPATVLAVLLLCFNLIGDGLRDALDPGIVEMSTPGETAATTDDILRLENLSVDFATAQGPVPAVRGVSFGVKAGECLGIVGESGAGKSQALLAAMGLLAPNGAATGRALFGSVSLLEQRQAQLDLVRGLSIGMMFQDPMTSLTPHVRVGDQIAEPLVVHLGLPWREARLRALALLRRVRVGEPERRLTQYPHELSGGMRQRVMLAIAIACEPRLLIADEPTTALDVTVQAQILSLLAELKRDRLMAMVLITHDLGVVAGVADRVAVMRAGCIVEMNSVAAVLKDPRNSYTKELLRAVPRLNGRGFVAKAIDATATSAQPSDMSAAPPPATVLPPALAVSGLTVQFPVRNGLFSRTQLTAVDDVAFELRAGEAMGIVGESGCGKSTLARAVLQLVQPSVGRIVWMGHSVEGLSARKLKPLRRELQVVFQDPLGSLDPRMTVGEIVEEPLRVHREELSAPARRTLAHEALERVALGSHLAGRFPHELSGGQCQRVGIARAMVLKPKVLVCDEPVSALDVSVQQHIVTLLEDLKRESGMSLLFVSHNLAVVQRLCDRILVLYLGRMMELLPAEPLVARHPYTRALLEAVPIPDPDLQPGRFARSILGEPPSPLTPPSGCVYRTRCPHALDVCRDQRPSWEATDTGGEVACHRWREL